MSIVIRTNHHRHEILDSAALTAAEREEFSHYDWPALDEGTNSASFFRWKGQVYDLANAMCVQPEGELAALGWQGYMSWSWSNGLVVKYVEEDNETYLVVGYYYLRD